MSSSNFRRDTSKGFVVIPNTTLEMGGGTLAGNESLLSLIAPSAHSRSHASRRCPLGCALADDHGRGAEVQGVAGDATRRG